VANLLLVRANSRRKEIALRAALGASRWQLSRQWLAETFLLTTGAGVLGVFLANWGLALIVGLYHGPLPHVGSISVDFRVLLLALAVSLALGVALALVPSLHLSSDHLQGDLQQTGRGSSGGRSTSRLRNFLIVVQVALTLMLLVGAALLGRSFQRLLAVNPGFETKSAVAMSVSRPHPQTPADQRQLALLYQRLLERLRDLPGVIAVGGVNSLPMTNDGANGTFIIENGSEPPRTMEDLEKQFSALAGTAQLGNADFRVASAGYFAAMRIPLLEGRFFADADGPDMQQVAVVNQELVRRYWPNDDPIGKQLEYGGMDGDLHLLHIVGVAADVHDDALDAAARPMVYVNYLQRPGQAADFSFVLRGRGETADWIRMMRREARAIDPETPTDFRTLDQLVSSSLDQRRFPMVILGVFSGAALLIAMVGLYGIVAYITSQRTREIGIRMALGGQRQQMLNMILRQSFTLVLAGVVAGALGAIAGSHLLGSLLYGVSATDLPTYCLVIALLCGAALAASLIPAQRAARVNPAEALRVE
jgi:predicted permease